jgi:hypothetical protein
MRLNPDAWRRVGVRRSVEQGPQSWGCDRGGAQAADTISFDTCLRRFRGRACSNGRKSPPFNTRETYHASPASGHPSSFILDLLNRQDAKRHPNKITKKKTSTPSSLVPHPSGRPSLITRVGHSSLGVAGSSHVPRHRFPVQVNGFLSAAFIGLGLDVAIRDFKG